MANLEALMDGFLCKAAITNDYIMKRLVGVKKQLGNMGVVTRKHFSPSVMLNARTGGGGSKILLNRAGSRKVLARHLPEYEDAGERRAVARLAEVAGKPQKGLPPDKQRLQNLLAMHHEKAETQATMRFGDNTRLTGHAHPSVIEREARMLKRFGADAVPKRFIDYRLDEGDTWKRDKDMFEAWVLGDRWDKAYDYYRNLRA